MLRNILNYYARKYARYNAGYQQYRHIIYYFKVIYNYSCGYKLAYVMGYTAKYTYAYGAYAFYFYRKAHNQKA